MLYISTGQVECDIHNTIQRYNTHVRTYGVPVAVRYAVSWARAAGCRHKAADVPLAFPYREQTQNSDHLCARPSPLAIGDKLPSAQA